MFIEHLGSNPPYFFAVVITVVVSICIHELAHGVTAVRLGDRTPIESGHMTLNPAVHMGLFSILALLLAGISWGAMPVNPDRLRGRYGDAIVAVAGPVSNALLALLALTSVGLWFRFDGVLEKGMPAGNLQYLLLVFGYVNIMLAMFNLIPIPPLDGSRILANFSDGYKSLAETLNNTGASMMVFVIAFMSVGKVISPAAFQLRHRYLELVSGLQLVSA
jgi:Zn-dependent protease